MPAKTAAPGRLLTQVAGERRTGALVVGGHPGGTLYLIEGTVTYAESPSAPGVGELLTASGRLAGRTWHGALEAGTPDSRVGARLVEQGHLTQGELELCVLGALYDAAYFALSTACASVTFAEGTMHWLGLVLQVDAAAVNREARRRGRLLDETFPDARVDTAPVVPVPRPPVERVALTASQWELLVNADGQRTPADLAQLLGRAGYATILQLRRLAAAGLLELPDAPTAGPGLVHLPGPRGVAANVHRPAVFANGGLTAAASAGLASSPARTTAPGPASAGARPVAGISRQTDPPAETTAAATPRPRLARRKPGAKLPRELAADPHVHPAADEVLLTRLRTALRALR